ncbi:IS30 family transposase, partial [Tateyamaria sp.]
YSKDGMRDDLWWYLPTHRVARRPRRTRKRREPKFHRDVSILFRPDDVAHRRQFGHWEGDLMLFKQKLGQSNVTSLVERVSRFTVILKNSTKRTKPVMGKIIKAIKDLPHQARRSITFDRGSEFMNWPHLQAEIGTQTWFCDPSSPLSGHRYAIPCRAVRGKRERLKTPIDGPDAGSRASGTSAR